MEKKKFLTQEEQKYFEDFALALDSAIVNQYHGVLQELKVCKHFETVVNIVSAMLLVFKKVTY